MRPDQQLVELPNVEVVAADGSGGATIYLATYGRSVWRATISRPPNTPPSLPKEMNDILVGILHDGWGLQRRGGHIVPVPPQPPLKVLVIGLAERFIGALNRALDSIGGPKSRQ